MRAPAAPPSSGDVTGTEQEGYRLAPDDQTILLAGFQFGAEGTRRGAVFERTGADAMVGAALAQGDFPNVQIQILEQPGKGLL